LIVQARYFFQQLICGVSYCHHMVRNTRAKIILMLIYIQNRSRFPLAQNYK
jgi:hypothetical protein